MSSSPTTAPGSARTGTKARTRSGWPADECLDEAAGDGTLLVAESVKRARTADGSVIWSGQVVYAFRTDGQAPLAVAP